MKSSQSFGELLRQARVMKGLTQQDLADAIGVSRVSVSHWERGMSAPDTLRLVDLARMLGEEVFDWASLPRRQQDSYRFRASPGRVREDYSNHARLLRMPQAAYDLVLQRLNELRAAGVDESSISSAELLLCGSSTGRTPKDLGTLSEAEWLAVVDAAWKMIATVYRLGGPGGGPGGIPATEGPPTPSIEQAEAEAEVFRRLPALPPLEKKKGKRRA